MRLNRGTIVLLAASLVVIIIVLMLNSQRATAPDVTPTTTAVAASTGGPLFPEISSTESQGNINRFEITDNVATTHFLMTKGDDGIWIVAESASPQELATDQTRAVGTMSNLASLAATDSFTAENLADFGLDQPRYVMTLTASDGTTYAVKIGNQSPTNPRYYALKNDDVTTVYIVPKEVVDLLAASLTNPPYVATATPSPTATATANPFSEVEQTATAVVQQTATAQATLEMTEEVTAEATAEATAAP